MDKPKFDLLRHIQEANSQSVESLYPLGFALSDYAATRLGDLISCAKIVMNTMAMTTPQPHKEMHCEHDKRYRLDQNASMHDCDDLELRPMGTCPCPE
jgi:hypothetical protein